MWLITSWEENKCCYKLSKCTKWHLFYSKWSKLSFWVKIVVILSVALLVTTIIFFSAWDKSCWNGTTPEIQPENEDLNLILHLTWEYHIFFMVFSVLCLLTYLLDISFFNPLAWMISENLSLSFFDCLLEQGLRLQFKICSQWLTLNGNHMNLNWS